MAKVLIGSTVRQKKVILEQFLLSLYELNLNGIEVDYAFVDDNDDTNASTLLGNFRPMQSRVWFFEAEPDRDSYVRDEVNHYWNNRLVTRVANNKGGLPAPNGAKRLKSLIYATDMD